MNLDAYKKLTPKQKAFLDKQVLALEAMNGFWTTLRQGRDGAPGEGRHPGDQVRRRRHQGLRRQGLRRRLGRGDEGQPRVRQEAEDADVEVKPRRARRRSRPRFGALIEALALVASLALLAMVAIICGRRADCATSPCPGCRAASPGATRSPSCCSTLHHAAGGAVAAARRPPHPRRHRAARAAAGALAYACEWIADVLGLGCCLWLVVYGARRRGRASVGGAVDQDAGDARVVVPGAAAGLLRAARDRVRVPHAPAAARRASGRATTR